MGLSEHNNDVVDVGVMATSTPVSGWDRYGHFESLRLEAGTSARRAGNVDLVEDPTKTAIHASGGDSGGHRHLALCHVLNLLAASHPAAGCDLHHAEIKYIELASTLLAVRHFNEGDGSVVPDLDGIDARCPIRLTTEFHDSLHTPSRAVQALTHALAERDPSTRASDVLPCAVHGAGWSSVSKPTAVVSGSYGLPQMSSVSTSPELSDGWSYPLFSRTVPTDDAAAAAAARFLVEFCGVQHAVALFINDSYGNGFHRAFRRHGLEEGMEVASVPLPVHPTKEEVVDAVEGIVRSGYRYVFAVIFEHQYDRIMAEAVRRGVAGTGEHFWLLGNNGIKTMLEGVTYEARTDTVRATGGIGIMPEFGGEPDSDGYRRFLREWEKLGADDSAHFDSKMPDIDGRPGRECFSPPSDRREYFSATTPVSPAPFAYDTIVAMGLGACRAYNESTGLDGPAHAEAIVTGTHFEGATGLVHIDPDTASRNPLTFGYVVFNAVERPDAENASRVTFEVPESVLLQPNEDGTDWIVVTKTPFQFSDGGTVPPLDLPLLIVDKNYIGNLRFLGYVLCAVVVLLSLRFSAWTWQHRTVHVVRASQPIFLVMVCAGTLVLGFAILPLSIDDEHFSQRGCDAACISTPWLASVGFVTAFSALFSKSWRINRIFHNPHRFRRVKVTERDVLRPYVGLMAANVTVLSCWTALAPLRFVRRASSGTDPFGRVVSSYGSCVAVTDRRGGAVPYIVAIVVINLTVVVLANLQAYQARRIHTEYSESRYIAMVMGSLLQIWLTGIPLMVIVREKSRAYFVVGVFILFISAMAVLLLIFIPKMDYMKHRNHSAGTRASAIERSLRPPAPNNDAPNNDAGSDPGEKEACQESSKERIKKSSDQSRKSKRSSKRSSTSGKRSSFASSWLSNGSFVGRNSILFKFGLKQCSGPASDATVSGVVGSDRDSFVDDTIYADDSVGLEISIFADPVQRDGKLLADMEPTARIHDS